MIENQKEVTLETLAVTLDTLAAITKTGFDDIEKRFDDVDRKFNDVHSQLAHLNEKIDAVDASLRVEIRASRDEMRHEFVRLGQALDDHEVRITRIEHELAP